MKYSLIILSVFFQFCSSTEHKTALLEVKNKIIDLGEIPKNYPKLAKFKLKNISSLPIQIKSVNVECECTIVNLTNKNIKPGMEVDILVKYNNSYYGYFQKAIYVEVSSMQEKITLIIRGYVF